MLHGLIFASPTVCSNPSADRMCGATPRATRQTVADQDLGRGKSQKHSVDLQLYFCVDRVNRLGALDAVGSCIDIFLLFLSLQVEPVLDADARQLLYIFEMEKRRKAMRAVTAVPEAAAPAKVAAEAVPPQVPSGSLSLVLPHCHLRLLRPQKVAGFPLYQSSVYGGAPSLLSKHINAPAFHGLKKRPAAQSMRASQSLDLAELSHEATQLDY